MKSVAAMPVVLRAPLLRLALVALLLVAQHGALSHAFLHFGNHAHHDAIHGEGVAHTHDGDHDQKDGKIAEFCALDLVYSQVLSAMHATPGIVGAGEGVAGFSVVAATRGNDATVPYLSRGPPAFS